MKEIEHILSELEYIENLSDKFTQKLSENVDKVLNKTRPYIRKNYPANDIHKVASLYLTETNRRKREARCLANYLINSVSLCKFEEDSIKLCFPEIEADIKYFMYHGQSNFSLITYR